MDLKLFKMCCKDSKQHHVMFHELCSVSSLLCIAQNVRIEIPCKVLYFETPFLMICLGVLCFKFQDLKLCQQCVNRGQRKLFPQEPRSL